MSNVGNLKTKLYKEELVNIEFSLSADVLYEKLNDIGRTLEKARI